MKFFYYFAGRWVPIDTALMTGRVHNRLAVAAEKAGFYGVCMDEHPAPVKSWLSGHGHHCFDPFVMLAAVGAMAPKLKLLTYLAILPYRNPFQFTKAATSLDVMSDGRAIVGVGVGYMKGEFDALGVDFEKRNALFDEAIEVYRRACGGEYVSYKGSNFVADEVQILPHAIQLPHPPLWLGGNSKLTLRRVAAYGQGWLPMPLKRNAGGLHKVPPLENVDDLRGYVNMIGEFKAKAGRATPTDVVISSQMIDLKASPAGIVDQIRAFQAAGATGVTINGQGKTADEAEAFITRFGEDIIAKFAP